MNNRIEILAQHLEQEISWIEQLNLLLTEEKEILTTRQFTLLEEMASKKQLLSEQIEESAKQRVDLINSSSNNKELELSLKEFLKNSTKEETDLINRLNSLLFERLSACRELNAVNGQVIASNIHTRQQIANALAGNTTEAVSVYTATGNLKSSSGNNHHQEA